MPIVGLDSIRKKDEEDEKRNNQYYTGGVNSQGGGSGLSVVGGNDDKPANSVLIKLYKNGYIENGNEFCKCDDTEEHKRIYQTLIEGYVPKKYENLVRTQGFKIYVDDHREEIYQPPPPRFGYKGNTLGSSHAPAEEIRAGPGMFNNYPQKETVPIRVNLAVGRSITLNVTEDWNCEDLYAAVAEQTPDLNFELMTAFPPKKIGCTSDKVLKQGLGKTVIRQVKHSCVC